MGCSVGCTEKAISDRIDFLHCKPIFSINIWLIGYQVSFIAANIDVVFVFHLHSVWRLDDCGDNNENCFEVVKCDRFLYQSQIGEPLWKGEEYQLAGFCEY
jgi:hypothetical protein